MQKNTRNISSTELLVTEAERRAINVISFPDVDSNTHIFELNNHREPIYYSRTDHNGTVTNRICNNKIITTTLLRRAGFPVPADLITNDLTKANEFLELHQKVVVKPISNTGGTGITTGITTQTELNSAFETACHLSLTRNKTHQAIIQQHINGEDYRILVINMQHIYSIHRIPAHVIGDGKNNIIQLINQWNKQRKPECQIQLNSIARTLLQRQNLTLSSIPSNNVTVRLAGVANYHSGGSLHDATNDLCPAVKQLAKKIARYFNAAIIGIDLISPNIAKTPGYIIELNTAPDLTIHHFPDTGQSHDVASKVIDLLFPETTT